MKKKNVLYLVLLLFTISSLTSCNLSDLPFDIPGITDNDEEINNDNQNNDDVPDTGDIDDEEEPVVVTLDMLKAVVFESKTFDYTGETCELVATNVPKGASVEYKNNGKVNPGSYTVKAIITYEKLKVEKSAKLTINQLESVITADENQTVHVYGGNVYPSFTLNNDEQEVTYTVYSNGSKVAESALYREGKYTVEITTKQSTLYSSTTISVEVTVVASVFDVYYNDEVVLWDGEEHQLVLSDESKLPSGYTVVYENNKGTDVGSYYAIAKIKDASGNVVETHAATLTINYDNDPEFEQYLDEFFVWYLEGDQLTVNIFCEDPAAFGLEHYEAGWYTYSTISPEDYEHDIALFEDALVELREFKDNKLSPLQEVAYRKIEDFMASNIELYQFKDIHLKQNNYIDQFGGYVADFATYMEAYSLRTIAEVEDILDYINSTTEAFASYLVYLDDKIAAGYALSDYTIDKMRDFLKEIIDLGDDYYLADAINAKVDAADFLNDAEKASYKAQIEEAMDDVYMTAVENLYNGLEGKKGNLAEDKEGYFATYEDGKEIYLLKLHDLLGLNEFDPEVYISEVEALMTEAYELVIATQDKIVKNYGITSYDALDNFIAKNAIFEGTPEEMMEYLKEFAPTIVPDLKSNPDIVIKEMDAASAKVSNAVAYYMKSPLDNTGSEDITLNPLKLGGANDVLSTLAHEGYPGHLYAYVNSKEIGQHYVSTIMTSTAHAEGWATYVQLKLYEYAKENATKQSLKDVIDYLYANDLLGFLLETRLDFGIHAEGWDVEKVGKYLTRNGYNGDAAQEIYDLLIEVPSQYAAYGYGKIVFLKLHEEAKEILGGYYDEVEFNGMLHSRGWTDLGELENTYKEYMKAECHKWGIEYNA